MVGESTTIDSILIEVQTDSADASRSLEDLAKSLGELKKNGAFKTVSKNLEALGTALGSLPNVYKASNSLRTLANSIQSLKEVGSVSGLANSLKKLPEALNKVGAVDLDYATAKIEELARAVTPLTQIKASGFSSMVNSMAKIEKVTASLDSDKIKEFADKIEELNKAVDPFATKMGTIATAFKGLNTAIKQTNITVDRANAKVNVSVFNFANWTQAIRDVFDALQNVAKGFANVLDVATQWDGIAARFGRGFGAQAQETYAWIQKLNEEMGINIQQFMQYSSVYATMLTGFGVANEDASKMALGYAELTYDIWAGYNDIYRTFDEAAEAVRSAIAGEVEPVRRAGFTIVEATLQETAANHGLAVSLETATEAQKSYLRYLTLVDQAHAQGLVGTYAKEMNTAEGVMRTLSQQIKSLAQAFGSLFIPVLVRVIPWVQAFVELLTEAVYWLASLFGIEMQEISWDSYNSSASDAVQNTNQVTDAVEGATDAIEKMKNATIGIDELNVISPTSATGSDGTGTGGTGSGGFDDLDVDSLWDESIFKNIESQIDEIKEKIKGWLPILEIVGAAFSALGIALLIAQLGEAMEEIGKMEGLIGGLKKALSGLAILTINAVLTFMLADNYLEGGNLLNLVGEAIVAATSGYLMYKGFGAKGLALSLAVSIATQLAAITLNLADGGVKMDDPELWIQSAFTTALAGASGGILAAKGFIKVGTGKGIALGLLAGLSLTLAAITIGQVAADGKVDTSSVLTGIGSVVAAAGFGFMVGGPWGAAIGAAVGLTINVVGAAIGAISADAKKSAEEDLKERFGDIELTVEEVNAYVKKITAIPGDVTIDANVWNELTGDYEVQTMTVSIDVAYEIFDEENAVLETMRNKVNNIAEGITRDAMKIMLGIDISHEDYQANIDSYVTEAQEYLDQYYLTTSMAIAISSGDSSASLTSTLNTFYTTSQAELETLGAKLKKTVSEAFVDGEWIPDKLQEALELQKEIQEILDYTTDVEFRATLEKLKLEVSGTDLTPESFSDVVSGAQDAIQKKLDTLEEVKMSKLQVAIMEYDAKLKDPKVSKQEAEDFYKDRVAEIEEEFQKGKIDATFGAVDFGLSTLQESFKEELKVLESFDFKGQVQHAISLVGLTVDVVDNGDGDVYTGINQLVENIQSTMSFKLASIKPEVRKSMEELLKELEPTMEDYEKIAADARKAGEAVPEEVRNGLNDLKQLEALTNDVDAINYKIGEKFAADPVFLNTLATAKNAGKAIDDSVAEGLLNNMIYVTDESGKVVTGIKDSIDGEVIAVTPTLVDNMKQLGVDLSTGLGEGVEKDEPSLWQKFTSWCGGIVDWVKGLFDSHSPSRVFMEIGKDLSDGLALGMETNSIKNRVTTMWTTAKEWWDNNKPSLKTYTPSIGDIKSKVSSAWTTARDWYNEKKKGFFQYTPSIGSIYEKAKVRWDNAREWYNEKKKGFSQYTPSIGSIYEKAKVRWDNAREWYNKKKSGFSTYTPSIGSIVDKVKSAWSSAKSWWSKNVGGLSTKLNISVPKIKVDWAEATAFGKTIKYPKGFKLEYAANGGIFDQGSLIWAGERGPEVMATAAGGKTGVMNIEQMQEAVYEGVYAAITAAMGGKSEGGAQAVNVYLDGRQITAAVEQRQRERGASIMGNEVYSY